MHTTTSGSPTVTTTVTTTPRAPRFAGLGLDARSELAYQALLEHPAWTPAELRAHLDLDVQAADQLIARLRDLDLVRAVDGGARLQPVDPQVGLSALAARLDAELVHRREQVERSRIAISELVTRMGRGTPAGQVVDVCWGARDITARVAQLVALARTEVVAMSTPSAPAVDESVLPPQRPDGVAYRFVFAAPERLVAAREHWLQSLVDDGAEVRIGPVPTPALIIDGTTVALPMCDPVAGQIVGMAVLRLPSAVTAVTELFERLWGDATGLADPDTGDGTGLADRERDLLALLVAGTTDESAAARLGVSVRTVRRMVSDLMHRLGARSRFEAGARAVEAGWLQLSDAGCGRAVPA